MTDLRKAAEMALEALGTVREWEVVDYDPLENATTALRQALAQPANQSDCGHEEYKPFCQMCMATKQKPWDTSDMAHRAGGLSMDQENEACGSSTANSDINVFALEKIIEDIKATEREACIKLLDDFSKTNMVPAKDTWRMGLVAGANAIRARGEK